jgi:hypothetical protein
MGTKMYLYEDTHRMHDIIMNSRTYKTSKTLLISGLSRVSLSVIILTLQIDGRPFCALLGSTHHTCPSLP